MFLSDPRDTAITFSDPAQGEPFSFSLHDFFKTGEPPPDGSTDLPAIEKNVDDFFAGVTAAERQTRLVDTINAHDSALAEAADNRIETARRLTGVQLENPYDGGYTAEAQQRVRDAIARGEDVSSRDGDSNAVAAERVRIFNEKVDALAQEFPDKAEGLAFGQSLDDQARAIAQSAAYDGANAGGGFMASLLGGMWGSRRDPLFVASLFAGPGVSTAASAIGRVAMGALKMGLYNAGLQALAQPRVQAWRQTIGERAGAVPAVENVGMAFLLGAIPGAAIEGAHALSAPGRASLRRLVDGTASPADAAAAAKAMGVTLDDTARRELAAAANDGLADAQAVGAPPPGIAPAEHANLAAQATRFVEDPANNPPPDLPVLSPPRRSDHDAVLDEAVDTRLGARQMVDDKPVTFERFDPAQLTTDAAAFQYKGGGDASGVTDRLKNVTQWDPLASGKTLVFERADGSRVIADGHQRLSLAKRLSGTEGDTADAPMSDWMRANRQSAIDLANKLGVRQQIADMASARNTAKEISIALGGRLDPDEVRAVRDNLGIAPAGPAASIAMGNISPSKTGIRLDGYLFREVDGWTPEDVRAIAAKKNMQEGSGDAIDAARVLRDRPDLLDASLPITSPMMKNAVALARLSDEAFGMALNGVVPPNYAAAVGSIVSNKLLHASVLSDLVKYQPETEREARVLIGEIMAAGFRVEEQINLFGATDATRSLMPERVKILDQAMAGLSKDKRLFGTLAEKADTIEAAGNQLARSSNDAQLQDMLARLARRTGPVSDALNRAALQMSRGAGKAKAAEAFLGDVRGLLDRDGLTGLLSPPELKPALKIEPATLEALTAAETAHAARMEPVESISGPAAPTLPENANPSPRTPEFQQTASGGLREFIAGQHGVSAAQLHRRAHALQAEIGAVGKAAAEESGTLFVNPGPKRPERLVEKIARKSYRDASQVTDAARGGMIVDTPDQADRVVASLAKAFDMIDEGWKAGPLGYLDRKLLVRDKAGTVGEFQIIPSPMYEAKKGGGQKLYSQARSMPRSPERDALEAQQRDLYSAAAGKLGASWDGILETSSGPNSPSKNFRQASSDITPDVSTTSSSSTSDHGAWGSSTAQAVPAGVSTAGRQSQLQNVSAMTEKVGASAAAGNPEPSLFDSIAVSARDVGGDVRFLSRAAALADADKITDQADLVAACKE
jgi:hypothetical protein